MPIDIATDELLSLGGLVRRLPEVDGVRPNISTAWRWSARGIRGHRLETVVVGGRRCTTMAAYLAFIVAIAGPPELRPAPTPVRKRKRLPDAADILARAGIRKQSDMVG